MRASLRLPQLERREGKELSGVESPPASRIGANISKAAAADLSERVVLLPPAAAIGVKSAAKGEDWPANKLAVRPKLDVKFGNGAGQASFPDAIVETAVPPECGVVDEDVSGQKLAGVIKPIGEGAATGVGSKLLGKRTLRLSAIGAWGHTLVRHAVVATLLGVHVGLDCGEGAG